LLLIKPFVSLVFTIALLFLSNAGVYAQPYESVSLPFGLDTKEWNIGWQNHTDDCYICEFVPQGQKVENWKELVTLQFYPNLQNCSAPDFMKAFLKRLQKDEPKVTIRPISSSYDNVVVEWHVSNSKKNPDQYEVDRVLKGEQGLHMIHYAIKTNDWIESERTKWLTFLNNAKIKK
jgi:hypothetical protein